MKLLGSNIGGCQQRGKSFLMFGDGTENKRALVGLGLESSLGVGWNPGRDTCDLEQDTSL